MMRKFQVKRVLITIIVVILSTQIFAGDIKQASNDVAVSLLVKVLSFEKRLSITDEITVFVLDNHELAQAWLSVRGQKIGGGTVTEIITGSKLPRRKPTIVCIGAAVNVSEVTDYTRGNQVMSITVFPEMVDEGVSLGVGVGDDNKPKIFVNLSASKEEGLEWNTAIMKSAKVVK